MADPFLGELKLVSFNFAPKGWAMCNGQFLPINQNQALFALFGTMYGGNGQTTFALPDLRGRVPLHTGTFTQGQAGGQEAHTLTQSEMPAHNHFVQGVNVAANSAAPVANGRLANSSPQKLYGPFSAVQSMHPASLLSVGGSQAHLNMQPYLVLTWIVALQGIFPSRN